MTALLPITNGFPVAAAEPGDGPTRARRGPKADDTHPTPAASLRVLVVDDNLLNQQMALVTVALEGHKVEVADNGREAVEAVARGEFDLILMDIDMPVMDGLEATQAIRAMAGPQRDVWIVAVTGCEIGRSRSVCEALSFDDVIAKPYPPEALVRALMWIDETRPRHGTGA